MDYWYDGTAVALTAENEHEAAVLESLVAVIMSKPENRTALRLLGTGLDDTTALTFDVRLRHEDLPSK